MTLRRKQIKKNIKKTKAPKIKRKLSSNKPKKKKKLRRNISKKQPTKKVLNKKRSEENLFVTVSDKRTEEIAHHKSHELPSGYGDHFIYAMVRDPYWIYVYWEILKEHQERALAQLGGDWKHVKSILRISNIINATGKVSFFDIVLNNMAIDWSISVTPNQGYIVELGLLHNDGRFVMLVRSNEVRTPRAGMSDIIDEEWMSVDFEKLYALSGGLLKGDGSIGMLREWLQSSPTSGFKKIPSLKTLKLKRKAGSSPVSKSRK